MLKLSKTKIELFENTTGEKFICRSCDSLQDLVELESVCTRTSPVAVHTIDDSTPSAIDQTTHSPTDVSPSSGPLIIQNRNAQSSSLTDKTPTRQPSAVVRLPGHKPKAKIPVLTGSHHKPTVLDKDFVPKVELDA